MRRIHLILLVALCSLAMTAQQMRILSLNNSLIDVNNQPAMFNNIASAMGKDARWDSRTCLGRTLLYHYNDPLSHQLALSRNWDYVILQEMSSLPRTHPEILMQTVNLWMRDLNAQFGENTPTVILPMNWPYSNDMENFKAENKKLVRSYVDVTRDIPGIIVSPVGMAYEIILDTDGEDALKALYTDIMHPTLPATYLAACMEYATIFGEDPKTIRWVPEGLSAAEASHLRDVASQAMAKWRTRQEGRRNAD